MTRESQGFGSVLDCAVGVVGKTNGGFAVERWNGDEGTYVIRWLPGWCRRLG
jgi:uncharacterized membrane protein YeaQ/YmgE (transglycosylase-associated protein family)